MNKRIKKKKAKQALQREQERLAQELAQLTPEQFEEVRNTVTIAIRKTGKTIAYIFDVLVAFFKNLEVTIEETERQRTQNARRGIVQVPRYPANHRFTKTGVDNKKSRQPRRSFNRNQQTYRNHRCQARR
ncbi:hypothetical protein [Streptococcus suis]|uniref:hypothetical protein n=1 Tax=Streptococcus suis TaxID=1307 RepID=UPI0003FB94DF|nr:hypothetical protein [Streptococcus suis]